MQPAVFLDRDNTLILNDGDLGDPEAVRLAQGVPVGLKALRDAGYRLVVVTNQAGVARGAFSEDGVDAVHQRIAMLVDDEAGGVGLIDRFYYCPYHPEGVVPEYKRDHPWRKPHPGMILQAARDMDIDLSHSWMVGDQERDVTAGRSAGCRTILVTRDAELAQRVKPNNVASDFGDAVRAILKHANGTVKKSPSRLKIQESAPVAEEPKRQPQPQRSGSESGESELHGVRRAINELTEEIRSDRLRRNEFTTVRMIAGLCQLLVVLLALLGLLQLNSTEVFAKWMIAAGLAQLVTIALLVLDLKS